MKARDMTGETWQALGLEERRLRITGQRCLNPTSSGPLAHRLWETVLGPNSLSSTALPLPPSSSHYELALCVCTLGDLGSCLP